MRYLFLFLLCSTARAGIYLEPAVGYEHGKISETYTLNGAITKNPSSTGGGLTAGLKMGYHAGICFLGAEYEKSKLGISDPKDWSVFFGISVPMLRAWASYILSAQTGIAKGSGYKLGVGTSLFLFLGLNAEYSARNYDEYHGPPVAQGTVYGGSLKSAKITLSLPLGF